MCLCSDRSAFADQGARATVSRSTYSLNGETTIFFAGTLSQRHVSHAIRTQVDPDVYVVLDEKLFLFSNADARTAFENEEPGIVQVADLAWAEMESERAQKKGCFSCF